MGIVSVMIIADVGALEIVDNLVGTVRAENCSRRFLWYGVLFYMVISLHACCSIWQTSGAYVL